MININELRAYLGQDLESGLPLQFMALLAPQTREEAKGWLAIKLAEPSVTQERIDELTEQTIQAISESKDPSVINALNSRLSTLKAETLTRELYEYKQRQINYINAKAAYDDFKGSKEERQRLLFAFEKAEVAKLEANDWIRARFKKVDYAELVDDNQRETGSTKDEARKTELQNVITNQKLLTPIDDTPEGKAHKMLLHKLEKAADHRLKAEKGIPALMWERTKDWLGYANSLLFYYVIGRLTGNRSATAPVRPKNSPLSYRDWLNTIGSVLLNADNAILCGISVFVGVQALEWPFYSSIGMALAGAAVTMGINAYGFRKNILALLEKGKKHIPVFHKDGVEDTYRAYNFYKFILVPLTGVTSLVFTALAASTVTVALGIDDYWTSTSLIMMFGLTFIATWGLLTQETRKWFQGTDPEHPKRNDIAFIERTRKSLREIFGLNRDEDLINKNSETLDACHKGRSLTRLGLFIFFTGLTSYAAIMLAPRASSLFLESGVQNLIQHIGWNTLGGNDVRLHILQGCFMIGMIMYNAAASLKLSNIFTRLVFGVPVGTDDGKKHNAFYRYAYPFFAIWNAVNNGAFNSTELTKSAEAGAGTELSPAAKVEGYATLTSATSRSLMFFANTRSAGKDAPIEPQEKRLPRLSR